MSAASIAAPSDALVALSTIPVEIVSWPDELEREAELARAGRLRLLLVPTHATPPSQWDPFMDWIRLPTTDEDVWSRITALQLRVQTSPPPRLDDYGVLWRHQSWVSLAPAEARILSVLLEKPGRVCSRPRLASAWRDRPTSDHALNTYVARLRRRIEPLDLAIHTVRQRGYFVVVGPYHR